MKTGSDPITLLQALDPAASITAELGPADIRDARLRAGRIAAVAPSTHSPRRPPRHPTIRLAILLGAAALLLVGSLTPPVQALAERVSDLVGIGDEPSRDAETGLDEPDIVIGAGESPNGTSYEVVASADMNVYRDEHPETCISLDLPDAGGQISAGCLTDELRAALDRIVVHPTAFLGPSELGGDRLVIDGLGSTAVDSAVVEHTRDDGSVDRYPVEVLHLDHQFATQIGATGEATFLLGFLPDGLVPPPPSSLESDDGVPVPAPAPGDIGQGSPIPPITMGAADLDRVADNPAEKALGALTLVTYDAAGEELARTSLDTGPFSDIVLYSGLHRDVAAEQWLESCLREVLPRYGTPGHVKPQLPESFGADVNACTRQRTTDAP